jgi:hypothetical protein
MTSLEGWGSAIELRPRGQSEDAIAASGSHRVWYRDASRCSLAGWPGTWSGVHTHGRGPHSVTTSNWSGYAAAADNGRIQRHLGQLGGAYGAVRLGSSVLKLLGEPGWVQRFDRQADSQRGRLFGPDSCPLCLGKCTQDLRICSALGGASFSAT